MAITESKRQSDLEKRLKILRQQVYGKESTSSGNYAVSEQNPVETKGDISYLYQDLFKIGILTSLAIGIQIILFILTKNHILNLNFL